MPMTILIFTNMVFFPEEANASDNSSSSNESNPVTEIRFVPEDKGTCKY